MTKSRPLRRTILQSAVRFLIDARVFIGLIFYFLYRKVIRPLDKSYGDISTFTRSLGKILM